MAVRHLYGFHLIAHVAGTLDVTGMSVSSIDWMSTAGTLGRSAIGGR